MYIYFSHIAWITLLEICFFFYYIGPVGTKIIMRFIENMIEGPIEDIDIILNKWNISREQFINDVYEIDDVSDIENELYMDKQRGIDTRTQHNNALLLLCVEFWTMFCFIGILVYIIEKCYCKKNTLLPYRKQSIDDDELQEEFDKRIKMFYYCKNGTQYVFFGGSILVFQFIFFTFVIFNYKPLSIQEIKYFVYHYLLKN